MRKEDWAIWIGIIAGTTTTIKVAIDLLDRLRAKRKKPHNRKKPRKHKRK